MDIKSDAPTPEEVVKTKYMPFSYAVMKSFNSKPFWQGANTLNIILNTGVAVFLTPNPLTLIAIGLGIVAFIANVAVEYKD